MADSKWRMTLQKQIFILYTFFTIHVKNFIFLFLNTLYVEFHRITGSIQSPFTSPPAKLPVFDVAPKKKLQLVTADFLLFQSIFRCLTFHRQI